MVLESSEELVRRRNRVDLDRFIPNRAAMDFDYARFMLTQRGKIGKTGKENKPSSNSCLYRKLLEETFNMHPSRRILVFGNKPPTPVKAIPDDSEFAQVKSVSTRVHIPTCMRTLDAPDILDDYSLNLLDWGSSNVVCIALGSTVHLWNASNRVASELVTVDEESGPVTSVKWSPDGSQIVVGLNNSEVQLWDSTSNRLVTTLRGGHTSGIGAMDWRDNHILTTGGMDSRIINNDVRFMAHVAGTYQGGHRQQVCGLKWSASGQQLASCGNDNLLHIWDVSSTHGWLHRLKDHTAAVRALAWCPFQRNLLASGGAGSCIKFWNTQTGACLNSCDTGSEVCALLWNKNKRQLLSSHGSTKNQLTMWRYPSMANLAELSGHTSRVLYMAQSPDGCTVASAAPDETLRFWNAF